MLTHRVKWNKTTHARRLRLVPPTWIYLRYEECWAMMREQGIDTIFITDGNPTAVLDDLIRCGAQGLITEPNFASRPPSKSTPTSY